MGTIDFLGILVPTLLVAGLAAIPLTLALTSLLSRLGASRFFWHPALFVIAVYLIVFGLLGLPLGHVLANFLAD